jgi:hypothetical protein
MKALLVLTLVSLSQAILVAGWGTNIHFPCEYDDSCASKNVPEKPSPSSSLEQEKDVVADKLTEMTETAPSKCKGLAEADKDEPSESDPTSNVLKAK